jgi:hypothetical protein
MLHMEDLKIKLFQRMTKTDTLNPIITTIHGVYDDGNKKATRSGIYRYN